MTKGLSFKDITLLPAPFNTIKSRKDVDTSTMLCGRVYQMPVIASNMDTVYSPTLAQELARMGGVACVHRFCSIEENVRLFQDGIYYGDEYLTIKPWVSVGLGSQEYERAVALKQAGAEVVLIDVANAACTEGVEQFLRLRTLFSYVVVGNFGTNAQIQSFLVNAKGAMPDAMKVSIGSGSMCVTRMVTGVGLPSVTTILDCKKAGIPLIFDGGVTTSGDLSKALALGCHAVMCGKLFAATKEGPGEPKWELFDGRIVDERRMVPRFADGQLDWSKVPEPTHHVYRGSASLGSYKTQNKESVFRATEGEQTIVRITGTVENLMNNLSGGLRSSMTYLSSPTLAVFRAQAEWIEVSHSASLESTAHGKE